MPLPFPAPNLSPAAIPADRLPRPCKPEGAFAPNTALRLARRLFEGQIVGSGGGGAFPHCCILLELFSAQCRLWINPMHA
jgi:hypothetical protein